MTPSTAPGGACVSTLAEPVPKGPFSSTDCAGVSHPHQGDRGIPRQLPVSPQLCREWEQLLVWDRKRLGEFEQIFNIIINTALRIRPWPCVPAAGCTARQNCLSPGLNTPAAFWCLINDRRKYKINKKRFCPLMRCMQEGSGQNSRKWGLWRIAAARDLIYSW